jgi:Rrf2 family protein
MVYLALYDGDRPARKWEIAETEGIPADYVEQLLSKLRTAGLVKSRRGAKGGFLLGRDAAEITVSDVLAATEGPMALVHCLDEGCERTSECVTRAVWQEASDALDGVFSRKTIAGLAGSAKKINDSQRISFEI